MDISIEEFIQILTNGGRQPIYYRYNDLKDDFEVFRDDPKQLPLNDLVVVFSQNDPQGFKDLLGTKLQGLEEDFELAKTEYQKELVQNIVAINRLPIDDGWKKGMKERFASSYNKDVFLVMEREMGNIRRALSLVPDARGRKPKKRGIDEAAILEAREFPLSEIVAFNRAGFAACPYHNEKSPSFHYIKKKNLFHCFGCGKSGDAIALAQKVHGVDFIAAVKLLTGRE